MFEPLAQAKACTVSSYKKSGNPNELLRVSDQVLDGIYLFGGKNAKGELPSKMRYLKPTLSDNKVIHVEWLKLKQQGNPPCGRIGHTLSYLPINAALLVAGGRNDLECKSTNVPFLDDMHLFLLDQKAWLKVKYIPTSQRLWRLGNHSTTVIVDGNNRERILIFGGINE